MDRISGLSDDLLVKILSFLPTKVATSTTILSKRWEFLWMWLPTLAYNGMYCSASECNKLQCFLNKKLPLHRAPAIEGFHLQLSNDSFKAENIKMWVRFVVSRLIHVLVICFFPFREEPNILPFSLYVCKTLVTLKLKGRILLDVPQMVCLPSLKTLQLLSVLYLNEESFERLVSSSPVLEHLLVEFCLDEMEEFLSMPKFIIIFLVNKKFIIINPSLQSFRLVVQYCKIDGFKIDTPSLNYFKIDEDNYESYNYLVENMPKLKKAYIIAKFSDINSLIGPLACVEHLKICSKTVYGDGFAFNQLKVLKLCICRENSLNLLVQMLRDSPNLQELELYQIMEHELDDSVSWNRPSTVPGCLLSSLQFFKWSGYLGSPQERCLVVYILQNARRLKKATILTAVLDLKDKLDMITKLSFSYRASTRCRLVFV